MTDLSARKRSCPFGVALGRFPAGQGNDVFLHHDELAEQKSFIFFCLLVEDVGLTFRDCRLESPRIPISYFKESIARLPTVGGKPRITYRSMEACSSFFS